MSKFIELLLNAVILVLVLLFMLALVEWDAGSVFFVSLASLFACYVSFLCASDTLEGVTISNDQKEWISAGLFGVLVLSTLFVFLNVF